jgi:GntR family transcriptional regulator
MISLINRKSSVPLYHQLLEIFDGYIKDGVWRVGDKLPTENELAATFEVSKITVRQAIGILENEGRIDRQAGRGTFVVEPLVEYSLLSSKHSFEVENKRVELLELSSILPSSKINKLLTNGEEKHVTLVRRLICSANLPVAIQSIYLPEEILLNHENREDVIDNVRQIVSEATTVKETFEPVSLNSYESGLLNKKIGSPAIMIESVVYIKDAAVLVEKSVIAHGKLTTVRSLDKNQNEIEITNSMWL